MTNANTQISRKTIRPDVAARHETETAINAVFSSYADLPHSQVMAYAAREVAIHAARAEMARTASAERARLERENAAMRAQIDSVFASA